jgi:hypothetical protein
MSPEWQAVQVSDGVLPSAWHAAQPGPPVFVCSVITSFTWQSALMQLPAGARCALAANACWLLGTTP